MIREVFSEAVSVSGQLYGATHRVKTCTHADVVYGGVVGGRASEPGRRVAAVRHRRFAAGDRILKCPSIFA